MAFIVEPGPKGLDYSSRSRVNVHYTSSRADCNFNSNFIGLR